MKISVTLKKLLVGSTYAAALMFGTAHASIVQWSLSGVTFDDGGRASGTFSTDSVSGDVLTFGISTSAGETLPGYSYNAADSHLFNHFLSANSFLLLVNNGSRYLNLVFQNALNNAGAVDILAVSNNSYLSYECNNCGLVRRVTAGEAINVSAVPEPATFALVLAGLGGLGFTARRRKSL